MKRYIITISLALFAYTLIAQDLYKDVLYPTGTILKFRKEIALSESQVTDIEKITKDNNRIFSALKLDFDAAQASLKKTLEASKVDEISALEQFKKINILENEMQLIRLKMLINIKNELSEEQLIMLKKIIYDSDSKTSKGWNVGVGVGGDPRIALKGESSFSERAPLYILIQDGTKSRITSKKMEKIDSNNIESVSVLKGSAATSAYGKDGENGVVVIKLKQ